MHAILLIEDIADNAALVKRVLNSQGYVVTWAETAEGGLAGRNGADDGQCVWLQRLREQAN